MVGCILQKAGENYRVNIWGPEPATLSPFSFEGATKRNKPNLKPGSLIYCQVTKSRFRPLGRSLEAHLRAKSQVLNSFLHAHSTCTLFQSRVWSSHTRASSSINQRNNEQPSDKQCRALRHTEKSRPLSPSGSSRLVSSALLSSGRVDALAYGRATTSSDCPAASIRFFLRVFECLV